MRKRKKHGAVELEQHLLAKIAHLLGRLRVLEQELLDINHEILYKRLESPLCDLQELKQKRGSTQRHLEQCKAAIKQHQNRLGCPQATKQSKKLSLTLWNKEIQKGFSQRVARA